MLKKFHGDIDSVDYEYLDNYDDDYGYSYVDDDEYRKIGSVRRLFKGSDRDYFKPIRTDDDGFPGIDNNYMEYVSKGDRYQNLLPGEYLNMIRPYLRDLINKHKPIEELNNNNNNDNNSNNNNNNNNDDDDTDHGECKIQLTMQNSCISTKNFEEACTIHTWSKPAEISMGSATENVIDTLFNTLLQNFQHAQEHQMIKEANLFLIVLNYYIIIFIKQT